MMIFLIELLNRYEFDGMSSIFMCMLRIIKSELTHNKQKRDGHLENVFKIILNFQGLKI
jgi:hypothetical protein